MSHIAHLFRAVKRRSPMEELEQIRVVENLGFDGCAHARPGARQVLLADRRISTSTVWWLESVSRSATSCWK